MTPAERIIQILDEREIEYKEFAKEIGVKPQKISEWKNGKTRSYKNHLNEISQVLGVSIDYILTGDEAEKEMPVPQQSRRASIIIELNEAEDLSTADLAQVRDYIAFLRWRESRRHQ